MSSAIARNILRMFSACCSSWLSGPELGELRDAVDEVGHVGAEALLDVGERVLGVLGDVVEQRRLHRDRVEPELGQDAGDRERMGDVRLAATRVVWPACASRANSNAASTGAMSAFG